MYRAFGNTAISPGGAHGFDDDLQDASLAYAEGWATGLMLSLCPDGQYNWHEGAPRAPGEWPTCTSQSDTGPQSNNFRTRQPHGERNEGRVAAPINDFRDSPNDDNGASENRGRNGESDANSGNRIALATIWRDSMWGFRMTISWISGSHSRESEWCRAVARRRHHAVQLDVAAGGGELCRLQGHCIAQKAPESLLTGLRSFRDHALKPTAAGRRWIQSYYSNSPELAMILIRDPAARQAALTVIEHFSRFGNALGEHKQLERLVEANQALLPDEVAKAIETIGRAIDRRGTPELRREFAVLRDELDAMSGLAVGQQVQRAEREAISESNAILPPVRPSELTQGSRKADWKAIRKYLPKTQVDDEQSQPANR